MSSSLWMSVSAMLMSSTFAFMSKSVQMSLMEGLRSRSFENSESFESSLVERVFRSDREAFEEMERESLVRSGEGVKRRFEGIGEFSLVGSRGCRNV